MSKDIIWRGRLLDEPRLHRLEVLYPVDCLRDIPHLVCVDHEHCTGWSSVLALERGGVAGCVVCGQVRGVIDDGADDEATAEIVLFVGADLG